MKLLQVIASMNPATGGPCRAVRSLIPAMKMMGCESEVVCLDESEASFIGMDSFPIHAIGTGRRPWSYHSGLGAWLVENLSRFDAAILHGLWLYPGMALRRAAKRSKRPYFVFPHGMLDPWFQRDSSRRLKALRNWFYWQLVEHRIVEDAKGLLFTCDVERHLAAQTFRPYNAKMELSVGLGIPQPPAETALMRSTFREKCPNLAPDRSYFLFLSRIDPKKGVDLLIEAYAKVFVNKQKLMGDGVPHLVIAGPGGDTSYGRKMRVLAESLCPANSVSWPGMLEGDVKWGAIYGCEALVLPSHQENFGIAVAESLACGIPVLISDRVNIWREIDASQAGFAEPDTLAGTEALFLRWLRSKRTQKWNMRNNAQRCFLERFEVGKTAGNLIHSLELLLTAQHDTSDM